MADLQKTSAVTGQAEYTQSDSKQIATVVTGQAEYTQSDAKQIATAVTGQVEYVDPNDIPEVPAAYRRPIINIWIG